MLCHLSYGRMCSPPDGSRTHNTRFSNCIVAVSVFQVEHLRRVALRNDPWQGSSLLLTYRCFIWTNMNWSIRSVLPRLNSPWKGDAWLLGYWCIVKSNFGVDGLEPSNACVSDMCVNQTSPYSIKFSWRNKEDLNLRTPYYVRRLLSKELP